MTYNLWPHQLQAEPLLTSGSAILWHEMRLGKTRSALHADNQLLNAGEVQDLIVVTVASAKATWRQEVAEMGLSIPVYMLSGQTKHVISPCSPDRLGNLPRIYVLNWEILPHWQRWLQHATYGSKRKFCLVLDEGHLYLRNPFNKRYKAAQWLSRFAYRTWELTGTLLVKSGLDIYHQAQFLGRANPFRWMTEAEFGEEYCRRIFNPFKGVKIPGKGRKGGWDYGSLKNAEAVMRQLPAVSVLRMDDVADVPLPVQLPRWVGDRGGPWNHYRTDQTMAEEISALVNEKVRLTVDYVNELDVRPVVVFGWSAEFTRQVAERLEAPRIYGGTSIDDRERIRAAFQLGQVPVLVGNLRSLGLGVSLSRADHFVYGEPYWDAALYLQAQARGRSLEKKEPLVHHHLLVAGSVDEYVWKVRLDRGRAIDRLYDAAEQVQLQDEEAG